MLLASNKLAEAVLAADRKAATGRDFYDDGYFTVFADDQFATMQQRLNDSISAVAALIIGAWEQAGKPALPPDGPRPPRPVSRPKS